MQNGPGPWVTFLGRGAFLPGLIARSSPLVHHRVRRQAVQPLLLPPQVLDGAPGLALGDPAIPFLGDPLCLSQMAG